MLVFILSIYFVIRYIYIYVCNSNLTVN